jgi:hypothetical protein
MEVTIEITDQQAEAVSMGYGDYTLHFGQLVRDALRKVLPPPLRPGDPVRWGRNGGTIEAIRGPYAWVVDPGRDDALGNPGVLIRLDNLRRAD